MAKTRKDIVISDTEKKKNTSLRLSSRNLKSLKIRAIEEDTSVQQIIETLIEDYLSSTGKSKK